jgi:hypothetical protein
LLKDFKERLTNAVKNGPVIIFVVTEDKSKESVYDDQIKLAIRAVDPNINCHFVADLGNGNEVITLRDELKNST